MTDDNIKPLSRIDVNFTEVLNGNILVIGLSEKLIRTIRKTNIMRGKEKVTEGFLVSDHKVRRKHMHDNDMVIDDTRYHAACRPVHFSKIVTEEKLVELINRFKDKNPRVKFKNDLDNDPSGM